MQIHMKNGLPLVSLVMSFEEKSIELGNVLFDTGCAATVFDTDIMASLGLHIDFINGVVKRMYGVGGTSEACYEQNIMNVWIDSLRFDTFCIQLGAVREPYGFDGILGIDYMTQTGLKVDFERMEVIYPKN